MSLAATEEEKKMIVKIINILSGI